MGCDLKVSFCDTLRTGCTHSSPSGVREDQDPKIYQFFGSKSPYALGFSENGLSYRVDLKKPKDGKSPFRVYDDKGDVHDMTKAEALRALQITEKCLSEHRHRHFDFGQQLIYLRAKMLVLPEKIPTQSTAYSAEKLTVSPC